MVRGLRIGDGEALQVGGELGQTDIASRASTPSLCSGQRPPLSLMAGLPAR